MSDDLDALIAALRAAEDRRAELRRLLLGDQPDLAAALAELARAQERTEGRLAALTERVDALAAAQERTGGRLDALAAAQERTEGRLDALAAAQERTEAQLAALGQRVDDLAVTLGDAIRDLAEQVRLLTARMDAVTIRADRAHGYLVERRYAEKGHAYFQRIALRLRRLDPVELDEVMAAAGVSEDHAEQVRYADSVFAGRLRREGTDGYLVVETSGTIGHEDVDRAHERATILRRAGLQAVGVVAGDSAAEGVGGAARFLGVWQVTNGTVVPPDDGTPAAGAA